MLGSGRLTRYLSEAYIARPDNIMRGFYQKPIDFSKIADLLDTVYRIPEHDRIYHNTEWIVIQYIAKPSQTITEIRTICWPCTINGNHMSSDNQGTTKSLGSTRDHAYAGLIEEDLGIDPADILGAWISPVCPYPSAFGITTLPVTSAQNEYYWYPILPQIADITLHGSYAYFTLKNAESISIPGSNTITLDNKYTIDTVNDTICISDFIGNVIWSLPYGIQIRAKGDVGFSFSPLSGQMIIHFHDHTGNDTYKEDAAEGLSI